MKLSLQILEDKCVKCGLCVRDCTVSNLRITEGKVEMRGRCFGCGHCIAVCPNGAIICTDEAEHAQITEYQPESFFIPAENMLNFIRFRRSVRHFQACPVENEKLLKIIDAGRYTQSGSNKQGTSYIVVQEKLNELCVLALQSLNELGQEVLNEPEKFAPQIRSYARSWLAAYQRYLQEGDAGRFFFNAPLVILVISDDTVDAALASSNMELMTDALGLGTFFSGFFVRAANGNEKISQFLKLPEGKKVVTCLAIGYPDVKYYRTVPRQQADIRWI